MTVRLNVTNFSYYALHPMSPKLPPKDRAYAVVATIAMGIFTLGIGHLICGTICAIKKNREFKKSNSNANVRKLTKNLNNKNSQDQLKRLLSSFNNFSACNLDDFKKHVIAFEDYKSSSTAKISNPLLCHNDRIYMTRDNFPSKENELELGAFLAYLVMNDHIFSFSEARCGYIIELKNTDLHLINRDTGNNPIYDKAKLIKIDDHMQNISLPQEKEFSKEDRHIVKQIHHSIKQAHFNRIAENVEERIVNSYLIKVIHPNVPSVLDSLVEKKVIASWNSYQSNYGICIKIKETDLVDKDILLSGEWRDIDQIKKEKTKLGH